VELFTPDTTNSDDFDNDILLFAIFEYNKSSTFNFSTNGTCALFGFNVDPSDIDPPLSNRIFMTVGIVKVKDKMKTIAAIIGIIIIVIVIAVSRNWKKIPYFCFIT
jgi:hypothetical protein